MNSKFRTLIIAVVFLAIAVLVARALVREGDPVASCKGGSCVGGVCGSQKPDTEQRTPAAEAEGNRDAGMDRTGP